ncbi:hypothetical protein M3Y97_01050700 [Aphelenchoides bicaudatus]|nr:hypothetical protein M3Y97_01050700 [Aphelenchoides bicaudatus]
MALINLMRCRRHLNSSSTRRFCSRLIYFATPFVIAILFIFFLNTLNPNTFNFNARRYLLPATTSTYEYDRPFNLSNYNKYIFLADAKDGGRHGNIFFRIASLYGIGKHLERIACLDRTFNDKFKTEFNTVFPNLHNYVLLDNCWNDNAKFVDFHNEVWNYIYENTLDQYADDKYIWLNTGVLECPRFFHRFRQEIIKMFEFSVSFKKEIDGLAKQVFGDDTFHRKFALTFEEATSFLNVILCFPKNSRVKNIFTTKNSKPIDDMGIAIRYCDYFLWMAYLLPDSKQQNVYYNSLFFKKKFAYVIKLFREEEFAPPKWNRLVHDIKSDKVFVQDRSIQPILF